MSIATTTVTADWTVNDVMRCVPSSIGLLNRFLIDTCCGGGDTLTVAAERAGLSPDELVRELNLCVGSYQPLQQTNAEPSSCMCSSSARPLTVAEQFAKDA